MTVSLRQRPALLSLACSLALTASCIAPPPGGPGDSDSASGAFERPTAVGADWRIPDGEVVEGAENLDENGTCTPADCASFCGVVADGCGQATDCGACGAPASLQLSAPSFSLLVGEAWNIAVQVLDAEGRVIAAPAVTWTSDDPSVVRVGSGAHGIGTATGAREGNTVVRAEVETLQAEIPVAVEQGFVAVAAGSDHTCALTESGRAYCWGSGALGAPGGSANGLRRVADEHAFAEIAAGREHTCAITRDRAAVYCWGSDAEQQLAGTTASGSATPVGVSIPASGPYADLVAGADQTCLEADGRPYCWGGASADEPTAGYAGLESIALGSQFGCGVEDATNVTCWGPATELIPAGEPVTSLRIREDDEDDLLQLRALVAGNDHACVLGADDHVYCWGANDHGQAAAGSESYVEVPTRVSTTEHLVLDAGPSQTCASLRAQKSAVACWGLDATNAELPGDVRRLAGPQLDVEIMVPGIPVLPPALEHQLAVDEDLRVARRI